MDVVESVQRRIATAILIGLLAFGAPPPRSILLRPPPALVRVQQNPSPGAVAWEEFFHPLRRELN